jgi:hypothetical protein
LVTTHHGVRGLVTALAAGHLCPWCGAASNIQHPTSNIQHPTSNIQHSTFNIQHSTFNIQGSSEEKDMTLHCAQKKSSISGISLLSLHQWFLPHELSRHSNLPHPKFLIRIIRVILFIRGHLHPALPFRPANHAQMCQIIFHLAQEL